MTITINGSGTITGITAGGLPDATIQTADIVDLAVTPTKMSQKLTSGTAVASTSGTSIDFTGIPSWVKRITVMFNGVSVSGSAIVIVQVGSSSVSTSGYNGSATYGGGTANFTTGFGVGNSGSGAYLRYGSMTLVNISGNVWVASYSGGLSITEFGCGGGVSPTLGGTLDRVRITNVNGTDTFDAGSINILYEG